MGRPSEKKYRIRIKNWDKWQAKNTSRFIRLSTRLIHDPDFFELTLEQRYVWVALLLHAGSVGVEYELSASSARVLFKLRPGWNSLECFTALENKGLIEFDAPIIEKREILEVEKSTRKEKIAPPQKTAMVARVKHDLRFDDFWSAWPVKKAKQAARKRWASMKLDPIADKIIENVKFRVESDVGWQDPKYIPHAATFLNGRRWEDEMIQTKEHTKDEAYAERGRRTVENAERAEAEAAGETYDPNERPRSTLFGS